MILLEENHADGEIWIVFGGFYKLPGLTSVESKVGNGFSTAKTGKTLTVHPKLLEKMQNDPDTEKEMKELIKGVESAVNMLDSVMNASGWSVVFKHDYIDENGKYRQIALVRNDFMLNMSDELREGNAEKTVVKERTQVGANLDL